MDPELLKMLNKEKNTETQKPKKKLRKRKNRENLSWVFYIEYFKGLDYKNLSSEDNKTHVNEITNKLKNKQINRQIKKIGDSFTLEVDGMGLIVGSGYPHNIKNVKESLQLGLSFDYTTGYPVIPSSSIKGVIVHVLEDSNKKEYRNFILKELEIDEEKLKQDIEKTIFLDAEIISGGFDDEYITPHRSPTKNPIPLKFLKIKPTSKFMFQFIFKSDNISRDKKLKFFERIIKDFGLGAKSKTGYGYFK
jgi:CRISPR-associated protein Cmr6